MGDGGNQKFYREFYEDSPLETATIQRVNKTPVQVSIQAAAFLSSLSAADRERAELNIPHYSCAIQTGNGRKFENVPWISPYTNPKTGAGLYVIPKAGTKVLIAYAKKGQPYIVGFITEIAGDGRYTGNREVMPDGSMALRGDSGNKVVLLDGGVIIIQSTPICRRTYSPSLDQIRDFCRNYFLTTSGGFLNWVESTDGQRLTTMRFKAFEKAGGEKEGGDSVEVKYGTHAEGEPNAGKIFSFVVSPGTTFTIGKDGEIVLENKVDGGANSITINNDGEFTLNNAKTVKINATDGSIELVAGSGTKIIMAKDGAMDIESPTRITIKAPLVQLGGAGGLGVARIMDDVLVNSPHGPLSGFIVNGSGIVSSA